MKNMVRVLAVLLALWISLPAMALAESPESSWGESVWTFLSENVLSIGAIWSASEGAEPPDGSVELGPGNDPDGSQIYNIEVPTTELGPMNDPNG